MITLTNLADLSPILIVIITVLAVVSLGLLIVLLIMQNIVSGYFSSKKFAVKSKHKVEPLTGAEKFELMVFNNNVEAARVLSFGFFYRSNSVDFFDTYFKNKKLPADTKLIIMSRDFIKLEIEAKLLQDLIEKHNDGDVWVAPVFAYVTDLSGHIIKYPAREVRRIIYRNLKAIDNDKKAKEKAVRMEACRVKREKRQAAFSAFFKPKAKATPVSSIEETKPEEAKK